MPSKFFFSVVVPTFSRTDEVTELLTSLKAQEADNFEVVIADGSLDDSVSNVMPSFNDSLQLIYLHEKGLGISESRNWGVENAKGDYIIFFDSDCVIPPHYFKFLDNYLSENELDAFGGPDKAHDNFSLTQKAISYAMTSFFTTGGIRGSKKHVGQYQPRSFNMGIKRKVFNELGGFSGLKVSEDIDLSLRLYKAGCRVGLIENAYVFHKRRSTFYKFFRQVSSFGSGRIDLQIRHGNALKPVHLLPAAFTLYIVLGLITGIFLKAFLLFFVSSLLFYFLLVLIDSTIRNRNIITGILSIYSAFIMHIGYGSGMLKAIVSRYILKNKKETLKPEITRES